MIIDKSLVSIENIKIHKSTIFFTRKTQTWCKLPYKNSKNGCPNYNKNPLCPPKSPFLFNFIKSYNYFYLIYIIFDFNKYKLKMKLLHSNWSEDQLGNRWYWQSQVKVHLRLFIEKLFRLNRDKDLYLVFCGSGLKNNKIIKQDKTYSMEAIGIHVYKTLENNNIKYELKPKNTIKLVSLLCSNKEIIEKEKKIEINKLI